MTAGSPNSKLVITKENIGRDKGKLMKNLKPVKLICIVVLRKVRQRTEINGRQHITRVSKNV